MTLPEDNVCEQIERLIDRTSLLQVMTALECICGEKADIIRAESTDFATAKLWDRASKIIGKAFRQSPVCDL